ncbi:uncharacterized protein LACBIDRAFT_328518 [Laccaria bicolor S238N-H82]|uniref:Predicted protein n=1 Tax=Laccaria bicolor (strain S238N-H82 / ATCC MYA-4686) TaxID=486041 RepID=B0DF44_LACBS|nr:uncharacterized protein LACBIDRAFT_328518 [Laccaria bicolor S238N-H82]EDR06653.1 predicted protein [Laccaria bicolor S238N-H82]|eukprot:XP_001882500.1 predicted protein [Laccaria bicolor S238N-H82]
MFFIGGMDLNLLRFLLSRARSDSPTLREDVPQNRLRNGQGLVELGQFPFSLFCPVLTTPQDLNLLRFLWSRARSDTPTLREDTLSKPFTKRSRSHGARTSICFVFCGRGLVPIPPRSVKTLPKTVYETLRSRGARTLICSVFCGRGLVRIPPHSVKTLPKPFTKWSRSRGASPTLREDAPQNHLRNGQGLVELGLMELVPQSAPDSASFSMVLDSFGYLHTP